MKRPIVITLGLAAIAILIMAAQVIVSTLLARMEMTSRINALTDERVTVHGDSVATLFPSPGIVMEDIVVTKRNGAGGAPLMTIPKVRASLNVFPFLAGRLEVGTLTLFSPHVRVDDPWADDAERRAVNLRTAFAELVDMRVDEVIVHKGVITRGGRYTGGAGSITALNLRLARRPGSPGIELSGSFAWRAAMVEIDAELDDARAVFEGTGGDGRLRLEAGPARVRSDVMAGSAHTETNAEANEPSSASLRYFVERLRIPIVPGATFGPLLLAGTFEVDGTSLSLSDATLELDGDAAEGTFSMRLGGGRPVLAGSLSFDELELGSYLERLRWKSVAELFTAPSTAGWLSRADIDVTVAAAEVDLGDSRVGPVAAAIHARDGRTTFDLNEAGLAGGSVEGKAEFRSGTESSSIRLSACLREVSAGEVARQFGLVKAGRLIGTDLPLQGTGSAALELSAGGHSLESFEQSLSGRVVADVRDGIIGGIDIESTLERLAGGNTVIAGGSAPFIPVAGRTKFDSLLTYFAIDAGAVRVRRIRLDGGRYRVVASGGGDLPQGVIEARGLASLFGSESTRGTDHVIVHLPFGVGGTLRHPVIVPGIPRVGHGPHMETEVSFEKDRRSRAGSGFPEAGTLLRCGTRSGF